MYVNDLKTFFQNDKMYTPLMVAAFTTTTTEDIKIKVSKL
jgi:hypothetical protein